MNVKVSGRGGVGMIHVVRRTVVGLDLSSPATAGHYNMTAGSMVQVGLAVQMF